MIGKNYLVIKQNPRVDFIVADIFPEIIKEKYNSNIELIIPELPLHIKTLYDLPTDKSYKVDFYLYLESGVNIFIEFKTDLGSRRNKQDEYLLASQKVGMNAILNGIIKIYNVTTYKDKYMFLLNKLKEKNLICYNDGNYYPSIANDKIEVLYIQPKSENENEIGFNKVAEIMSKHEDQFYKRFAEILKSWSNN